LLALLEPLWKRWADFEVAVIVTGAMTLARMRYHGEALVVTHAGEVWFHYAFDRDDEWRPLSNGGWYSLDCMVANAARSLGEVDRQGLPYPRVVRAARRWVLSHAPRVPRRPGRVHPSEANRLRRRRIALRKKEKPAQNGLSPGRVRLRKEKFKMNRRNIPAGG
jgi:hypothetical protein